MKYGEGKGGWCTRACILFWHDKWTGDVPLKSLYPQLFVFSANKEACISDVLSPSVGNNDKSVELKISEGIQ